MAPASALFGRAPAGGRIVARPLVPALGSTPVRALVSRRSEIGDECGRNVAERMTETNGVELCTEGFGDPADPPLLLIMGMSWSMLWWEEGFCRMPRRRAVRDPLRPPRHRPIGHLRAGAARIPGADLVGDAARVLDVYGIPAAHVVGVSIGGTLAQLFALDFADRVLSLVVISTSFAVPG